MKILITGAAGYIGSYLLYRFAKEDYYVIGLDNESRGKYSIIKRWLSNKRNIALIKGDITDRRLLTKIANKHRDINLIIHFAAIPGLRLCKKYPQEAIKTNIYGTYNLLHITKILGDIVFIFASSAAVYGIPSNVPVAEDEDLKPLNLYGFTKKAGEELCRLYSNNNNIDVVVLRFGNVYGIGLYTWWETVIPKFVKQALTSHILTIYGTGEQTRDFIHIRDLARAIELIISKGLSKYNVYNIANQKPITINTIADIVTRNVYEITGIRVKKRYLPMRREEVNIPNFHLSNRKIKELGYSPKIKLDDAIKELIISYINIKRK